MEIFTTFFLLAMTIAASSSLPMESQSQINFKSDSKYASHLSQLIATKLLQDSMEIDGNNVYSPLGVTTILAILGEASEGETYMEFKKALKVPSSKSIFRESFKNILSNFKNSSIGSGLSPSFKTWFYIYRNNTVKEEFKQLLTNYYCVDVKDINRSEYNWDEPNTSYDSSSWESSSTTNSKDVIGFETLKNLNTDEELEDKIGNDTFSKEASKFDKYVDDKQYVEAPLIREEIARQKLESDNNEKKLLTTHASKYQDQNSVQENETVQDEEKIDLIRKNFAGVEEIQPEIQMFDQKSNEPQKITIPLQKLEEGGAEIIKALESHFTSRRFSGARNLFGKDDIASALSASSINGRDAGSRTKMLLFNGLYYRGNWAYPFQELRSSPNEIFHLTSDQSLQIPMMHARGKYLVADLEAQNALAISFPYENKRYSLLVIMPKDIEGLHYLLENLSCEIFTNFKDAASERNVYISIPKFQVEETSRSESMLKNLGLRTIFNRGSSNLSLLSEDSDLHVEELVQFVSVRVDEGGSVQNGLSASNNVGRAIDGEILEQKIEVNRPFLYFVVDNEEDFVIVSGKITVPKFKADIGIDLNIEFTQS